MILYKNKSVVAVMLIVLLTAASLIVTGFALGGGNGDKITFFGNVHIRQGENINGSAVAIFGSVTVDGGVAGDAVAIFGDVNIKGAVNGSAVAVLGTVRAKGNAIINGDAVGVGGGVFQEKGTVVRGEVADANISLGFNRQSLLPLVTLASIFWVIMTYGLSWLVLLIIPERINNMVSQSFENLGRRFGIGTLSYILCPIIVVALAITIVGILVIPFFVIVFSIVAFISMIPMKIAIGRRIASGIQNRNSIYIHLLIGVVIVYLLKLIPVIGWLVYAFLSIVALGMAVDTRLGGSLKNNI